MSFNLTLFGKVFYVTPWMVYSTGVKSDNRWFALNEYDEELTVQPRNVYTTESSIKEKETEETVDEAEETVDEAEETVDEAGETVDDAEEVVQGKSVDVVEYIPEMTIGNVHEKNFTRIFPSYMSLVGLYTVGKGVQTGYRQRHVISNTLGRFRRS